MNRPTFFLSSTIYDFKDLRSALKYVLEQQGCEVLASEFPDFRVEHDKHSYEACLSAIEACDYFVLLIGSRVGGWYDPDARVSITQREYRKAYELHRAGRLKILAFVRAEIWEFRENRAELRRFLQHQSLSHEQSTAIASHPSRICEDADFILSFVSEVSRNSETKAALKGEVPSLPTGNWLYTFSEFRQIIDAIRSQFIGVSPVEQSALRHLLAFELRENIKTLLCKTTTSAVTPEATVANFYLEHPITKSVRLEDVFEVNGRRWSLLSTFGISLLAAKVADKMLDSCLASSMFLEYDAVTGRVKRTAVLDALHKLSSEIAGFRQANSTDTLAVIFEFTPRMGYHKDRPVPVPTQKLLMLLGLYNRWINIVKLSSALLVYLEGGEFKYPILRPASPIPEMSEEIAAERPSDADVDEFLADRRRW